MIIRKPYAFVIKHFRLIHLLLLVPMVYLLTRTAEIRDFFSAYVASNYSLSATTDVLSSLASNYINFFMYLAVILIIVIFIIISALFQRKEKPNKFYNISLIYYIILFILITACFAVFRSIENDTINTSIMRLIRDLTKIIHYSQYVFIIFTAARGLGFNIKQFDFKSDLDELEISSEDSEEIEFLIGIDTYKTLRAIRRFIRELKYYYKENKFIFIVIFIVIIGIIGTSLYMNKEVYQRVYSENESIALGYLNFVIKDSYISNLTQGGDVLKDGKHYLILQLEITNRYRESYDFCNTCLELLVDGEYYFPDLSVGNYFKDFGNPYTGTYIQGNSSSDYILVYEIDSSLINKDFYITVFSYFDSSVGGVGAVNNQISLDPTIVNSNIVTNSVGINNNISLANTMLGDTSFFITDYEITNRYRYCTNEECTTTSSINANSIDSSGRTTLLVMGYNLTLDSEAPYMDMTRTYRSFFEDFVKVEYTINNSTYTYSPTVVNPSSYSEKVALSVPSDVNQADSLVVILTVRNVSYRIKLF